MRSKLLLAMVLFIHVLSQTTVATEATFRGLGYLPGSFPESEARAVSGDGSVVVGLSHGKGFYWTEAGGMVGMEQCRPTSVSYDGSVIVGCTRDWEAFRWTESSGVVRLGDLPGGDFYSIASDVSYDGSVIVGQSMVSGGFGAFLWTESTGMQDLGQLPGGTYDTRAFATSADGTVVVGFSSNEPQSGYEAFMWTESSGMVGLGALPGSNKSTAYGISEDGSIIAGTCFSGRGEAFRWTESTGMIGLGKLPNGLYGGRVYDVSADGSLIVGGYVGVAFIWDESNGIRDLKEVLENDFGLDLTSWSLAWASGISADGRVIVGRGYNPGGRREAWVARISEPGPANTFPIGCVVGGDRVVEAYGDCQARITLDGSCSSDADSTAGTNDDINDFDWYEVIDVCDPNSDIYLGSGEVIECNLGLGEHVIVLEVTDKAGAFDSNEVVITVEDVTPPEFSLYVEPSVLWPPNHRMVRIDVSWEVSDNCDEEVEVSLVNVTSSEEDDGRGDGRTKNDIVIADDGSIYLRAERTGSSAGRVYTITYEAVDDSGNATEASAEVLVPDGYRWRHHERIRPKTLDTRRKRSKRVDE